MLVLPVVVTLTEPGVTTSVPVTVETMPVVIVAVPGTSAEPYTDEPVVMLPFSEAFETV